MVRLRAGESFRAGEERRLKIRETAVKKATTTRASAGVHMKSKASGSSDAAMPASRMRPGRAAAAAGDATVEDTNALDCGVCFIPLKPPIFQCDVGHVVCSRCRDKLAPVGKCHVCSIATRNYHRCHAMERLVESIRVPCPNAAHGCGARPAYYDRQGHCQTCPHVPRLCPGKNCNFLGSTEVLLDHFTGAHGWPPTTEISAFVTCSILLYEGFNFILADCDEDDDHSTTTATTTSSRYLFLLNVTRQRLGCSITVHFIGEELPSEELRCVLRYQGHSMTLMMSISFWVAILCDLRSMWNAWIPPMGCPILMTASSLLCQITFLEASTRRILSMLMSVSASSVWSSYLFFLLTWTSCCPPSVPSDRVAEQWSMPVMIKYKRLWGTRRPNSQQQV